ncbi:MAG: UbiA family prenyltransferase [Saprospiraceae bacterium]|nr:UbiA family prenyltransferase [Saprospiraceae bacterium]
MLRNFFHIIRWPNLLMLAVIQGIIYYRLLHSSLSVLGITEIAVLITITMIIAASGYVINDYYDTRIDSINKPQRWIAGNTWTLKTVLHVYGILVGSGALLSIFLAYKLSLFIYLLIYPLAIAGLWFYSYALKCRPITGNLWVALFCGGVVSIIALPDLLHENPDAISGQLWYYTLFAFLSTWYREAVKDLEDIVGDQREGCSTFPVRFGLMQGKIIAIVLGLLLITTLIAWEMIQTDSLKRLIFTVLEGSVVATTAFIWWAKDHTYFQKASLLIKGVMLAGTLVLLIN